MLLRGGSVELVLACLLDRHMPAARSRLAELVTARLCRIVNSQARTLPSRR